MNWHHFFFLIPFPLEGLVMFIDEFIFHRARGLPRWERLGHPLDTLTVLAPFLLAIITPYRPALLAPYLGLCAFSCIFVTKDEFVHHKVCGAKEQWIHAILFILHPLGFLTGAWIWMNPRFLYALWIQTAIISLFLGYQAIYWNFLSRRTA
jgi:hypothetical protein